MKRDRIYENVLPVTVLSSLVLASIALPSASGHVAPLAVAQARKPRPVDDELPDTISHGQKIQRSRTVSGTSNVSRRERQELHDPPKGTVKKPRRPITTNTNGMTSPSGSSPPMSRGDAVRRQAHRRSLALLTHGEGFGSSSSLPEQRKASICGSPGVPRRPTEPTRRHSHLLRSSPSPMSQAQKVRMLRQNYFRSVSQLLTALEGISSRLVAVPKPARLSALRAELALIGQDLPAEVDIPLICPPTLVDGIASRSKHHRIVRLNPAESTSLNSAEKVPYLLMLEVLKDDFDFDPDSGPNQTLLQNLLSEKGSKKRRLFDTTDAAREASLQSPSGPDQNDSVMEPANGDLSSPALLQDLDGGRRPKNESPLTRNFHLGVNQSPRSSMGLGHPTTSMSTPREFDTATSRSSTPGPRQSPYLQPQISNHADVSALADHMRTASQMLAQLELSAAKRPKTEVAAIKAKIIASMQNLEEQSFPADDGTAPGPSFDSIMAKAGDETSGLRLDDDELETATSVKTNVNRGADRMENDAKTGGIQRQGDRDDPSAATFGEAWEEKKERIRRSSPYGWARNWDLVSVIVKTGDDLRQEAFACQLIAICSKIWGEHQVDVWAKNMRILVTGESSGLIETITNAVSLHSVKRSLTLASMAGGPAGSGANANAKKRFATLQDHYIKTFGDATSTGYAQAVDCFTRSLAAYSVISYVFQLKDRHNGNILIDSHGHVIHIDFGFMLSNSPGGMGFEAAPFKLTAEYVELLGGEQGAGFAHFRELMKDAFQALRREAERIVTLVELMGRESSMACYASGLASVVSALRARFVLEKSKDEAREWVDDLVAKSAGSYYTRLYDTFQYRTQGIY